MARTIQSKELDSRTAREKLEPTHEPYWVSIGRTLHFGYRKGKGKNGGSWIARLYKDGKYKKIKLGKADDIQDANNESVLDYFQAQEKARAFAVEAERHPLEVTNKPTTVEEATNEYLEWYQTDGKALNRTKNTIETHITPKLGNLKLTALTTPIIRKWHADLTKEKKILRSSKLKKNYAEIDTSTDAIRKRKATANRILTVLKAALNHAWRDEHITSNEAWRKVKPFRDVDAPKIRYLSTKECGRIINACEPDFRCIVKAALLTGCRYGELTHLKAYDFDASRNTLHVRETKNGKARYVPLTDEGTHLFNELTRGKGGDDLILTRHDQQMWGASHQGRRLSDACKIAIFSLPFLFTYYGTHMAAY